MQESVSRFNRGSNEAATGMTTCPHCGHSFACGGTVKAARGGEIDESKKGQGRKFGIYGDGGEVTAFSPSRKRERALPRHELDVYRGENVPRGEAPEEDDEDEKKMAYAREIRRRRGY